VTPPQELGNCRLCHVQRSALREAPLLPGWALRDTAPILVRVHCDACERRLVQDEAYVARLAYGEDRLGLLEHVVPVAGPRPDLRVASLRGFNVGALARFAAAIFWRAHAALEPGLSLSRAEGEALREYVRGTRPMPLRLCFTLAALIESDGGPHPPWTTTRFPVTEKHGPGEDRSHLFAVAGLAFCLSSGDTAPGIAGTCLACGHDPHVVFTSWPRVRHSVTMTDALLCGVRKSRSDQRTV
jgi:hypothetical protein